MDLLKKQMESLLSADYADYADDFMIQNNASVQGVVVSRSMSMLGVILRMVKVRDGLDGIRQI
jgi:hypothetical protein